MSAEQAISQFEELKQKYGITSPKFDEYVKQPTKTPKLMENILYFGDQYEANEKIVVVDKNDENRWNIENMSSKKRDYIEKQSERKLNNEQRMSENIQPNMKRMNTEDLSSLPKYSSRKGTKGLLMFAGLIFVGIIVLCVVLFDKTNGLILLLLIIPAWWVLEYFFIHGKYAVWRRFYHWWEYAWAEDDN